MADVTQILSAIEHGDATAADQLWPLVYDELRRLARAKLAQEAPGQTLQPTALVHEAYLRLVGNDAQVHWNSRGHFFAAAAEAMRRILVENARRKKRQKRGGNAKRINLDDVAVPSDAPPDELLAIHDALDRLAKQDPQAAEIVKLRYFAGSPLKMQRRSSASPAQVPTTSGLSPAPGSAVRWARETHSAYPKTRPYEGLPSPSRGFLVGS